MKEMFTNIYFWCGLVGGSMFFEPLVINIVYFTNIDLFLDIIISPKNKRKLYSYFKNKLTL